MTDLSHVRLAPSDQVVAQGVGPELVILHVPSERFITLDDVGAQMWRTASVSATAAQAITTLLDEFDVERATLEADFASFAARLASLGLAQLIPITPA